jgi:TonB family protein
MNPLPGFQFAPCGRLHVVGARHPLEQMASATALRAATGALLLHALFFGSVLLAQLLAKPQPPVDLTDPLPPSEIVIQPPPSIAPGSIGPDLGEFAPMKRHASGMAGIPEPVWDLDAEAPTIPRQDEYDLPFDPTAGEEITGGRGGGGGTGERLDEDALDRVPAVRGDETFMSAEVMPVLVKMTAPDYPRLAREAGIEGEVIVRAVVDQHGRVAQVVVSSGPEFLRDAAAAAVRSALFRPALQNGRAVRVWVSVPIRFTLE